MKRGRPNGRAPFSLRHRSHEGTARAKKKAPGAWTRGPMTPDAFRTCGSGVAPWTRRSVRSARQEGLIPPAFVSLACTGCCPVPSGRSDAPLADTSGVPVGSRTRPAPEGIAANRYPLRGPNRTRSCRRCCSPGRDAGSRRSTAQPLRRATFRFRAGESQRIRSARPASPRSSSRRTAAARTPAPLHLQRHRSWPAVPLPGSLAPRGTRLPGGCRLPDRPLAGAHDPRGPPLPGKDTSSGDEGSADQRLHRSLRNFRRRPKPPAKLPWILLRAEARNTTPGSSENRHSTCACRELCSVRNVTTGNRKSRPKGRFLCIKGGDCHNRSTRFPQSSRCAGCRSPPSAALPGRHRCCVDVTGARV